MFLGSRHCLWPYFIYKRIMFWWGWMPYGIIFLQICFGFHESAPRFLSLVFLVTQSPLGDHEEDNFHAFLQLEQCCFKTGSVACLISGHLDLSQCSFDFRSFLCFACTSADILSSCNLRCFISAVLCFVGFFQLASLEWKKISEKTWGPVNWMVQDLTVSADLGLSLSHVFDQTALFHQFLTDRLGTVILSV